eukprot:3608504-Amphidinium_carterae.1
MDTPVILTNITIFGKLSFDDTADRFLQVEHLIVWGLLEIGTPQAPFGMYTGATARILLDGSVTDTESYVYIEEETLHNKVIAIPGRVETYGVPLLDPWLRMKTAILPGAEEACIIGDANFSWVNGTEIAFSPTETSLDYFEDVEMRTLVEAPEWNADEQCYTIRWSGGLDKVLIRTPLKLFNRPLK